MTAARLQTIEQLLKKVDALNIKKLIADVESAIKHPTIPGAIEALEEGAADGSVIAGLIPGGAAIAVDLGLAATVLSLLDEAVNAAPLAPDFGARLAKVHIHAPALFTVNHGPIKSIFGDDDGPERVFGFTPDP
ncbi:hypothetical protein GGD83_002844 [Rhodoblastus sphagnicola]|uniref:hypothetical protein n=1 Tax=Rhodoblastus sphagnicola TaxID=333368 RepID=UPI0011AFDC09|nr:hypothetical protein [Rhodoblastus sphagnicola]MBB4199033.1 hypothetical protein [Rhodoblastus sphagnicola]